MAAPGTHAPPTAPAKKATPEVGRLLQKAFEHHQAGRIAQAATEYNRILKLAPSNVDALHLMGVALRSYGRHKEAEAMFRRTVAVKPDFAEAYYNLGNACYAQNNFRKALEAYVKAAKLQPNLPTAHFNIGNAYRRLGDTERATAAFQRALKLKPDMIEAWHNLANTLKDSGNPKQAIEYYKRTLKLDPSLAEAHYNLALLLLQSGNLHQGFEHYEWRANVQAFAASRRRFAKPQWKGAPIAGRTLLLHAEAGAADTLQFCRYIPLLADQGVTVVVECPPALVEVLKRVRGAAMVIEAGQPLPPFDLHCPIPSLPRAFRTSAETIPAQMPYIEAHAAAVRTWRGRLANDPPFRIGLIWTGGFGLTIKDLYVLPQMPKAKYYSLLRGQAEHELTQTGLTKVVGNLAPAIEDFRDLSGVLANLDLLITVDSVAAHLAAAMGRPVWLVLPAMADWRWKLSGSTSAWYPGMRLYRQKKGGGWDEVMARVAADLDLLLKR